VSQASPEWVIRAQSGPALRLCNRPSTYSRECLRFAGPDPPGHEVASGSSGPFGSKTGQDASVVFAASMVSRIPPSE
jgi:hypothetical protein